MSTAMAAADTGSVTRPLIRRPWQLAAFVLWAVALALLVVRQFVAGSWPLVAWFAVLAVSLVCVARSERRGERLTR